MPRILTTSLFVTALTAALSVDLSAAVPASAGESVRSERVAAAKARQQDKRTMSRLVISWALLMPSELSEISDFMADFDWHLTQAVNLSASFTGADCLVMAPSGSSAVRPCHQLSPEFLRGLILTHRGPPCIA